MCLDSYCSLVTQVLSHCKLSQPDGACETVHILVNNVSVCDVYIYIYM